jgi:hypothetical protein
VLVGLVPEEAPLEELLHAAISAAAPISATAIRTWRITDPPIDITPLGSGTLPDHAAQLGPAHSSQATGGCLRRAGTAAGLLATAPGRVAARDGLAAHKPPGPTRELAG